jgi:hypothetical protein
MIKFLFWFLLFANLVLLAMQPGGAARWRDAARQAQQLHPEHITVLPPTVAASPVAVPKPTCVEVGDFTTQSAANFESRLARLPLPDLPQKRTVAEQGTHMVFVQPQNGQAGANRRLAQLRRLGFNDIYVLQDQTPRRWGISLGVFKSEESARAQLELVMQAGVTDARVEAYAFNVTRAAYRLYGLDAKTRMALDVIKSEFRGVETRECE